MSLPLLLIKRRRAPIEKRTVQITTHNHHPGEEAEAMAANVTEIVIAVTAITKAGAAPVVVIEAAEADAGDILAHRLNHDPKEGRMTIRAKGAHEAAAEAAVVIEAAETADIIEIMTIETTAEDLAAVLHVSEREVRPTGTAERKKIMRKLKIGMGLLKRINWWKSKHQQKSLNSLLLPSKLLSGSSRCFLLHLHVALKI